MRKFKDFPDQDKALHYQSFLGAHQIQARVLEGEAGFALWIEDEDQLEEAIALDPTYAPDQTYYVKAPPKPKISKQFRKRNWQPHWEVCAYLTIFTVVVSFLTEVPSLRYLRSWFYYSEYAQPMFYEIRQGQVWRLVSSVFLHGGWLHLGFNMLWFWQLGRQVEHRQGSLFFIFQFIYLGALASTVQYFFWPGLFVGMSGVVYGLAGYIWVMSELDSRYRYEMEQSTLIVLGIWLVLGFTGLLGGIANGAHLGGLLAGCILGFVWRR